MKKLRQLMLTAVIIGSVLTTATAAESFSVLLQKGIFAEETEGNLDAAIQIYEKIIAEAAANRTLIAQAQYRLGMCHLKKGKKEEAGAAFRRIVEQFPGETEVAANARSRLAELGQAASAMVVRQVWSGKEASGDSISPDGRYLAFIDWDTGNLALRDLRTGQNRRLTDRGSMEKKPYQFAESCAFSRDGKQIAYSWNGTNDSYALYLVSLEDAKSRMLVGFPTNLWVDVQDWSPDGKSIAVRIWEAENQKRTGGLALVSVTDGTDQKVAQLGQYARTMRFSPDGRYLAWDLFFMPPSRTNQIVLLDLRTGVQKVLGEPTANESFVGWTPGGGEIVFTSERRGTVDLWALKMVDGAPQGEPRLLKADVGAIQPVGMTRDGALFYTTSVTLEDAYVASVDFETGKVLAPPKRAPTRVVGSTKKLVMSGDGKCLFYRSGRNERSAYLLDLETGQEREVPNSRAWADRIGWWWPSPDHKSLLVAGQIVDKRGLYIIQTQTGEITPLALDEPGVEPAVVGNPFGSDYVAYFRHHSTPSKLVLVKHDLKQNREKEFELPGAADRDVSLPTPFPDGKYVFFNRKKAGEILHVVVGLELETGREKEFLSSKSPVKVLPNPTGDLIRFVTEDEQKRPVYALFAFANFELREIARRTVPENFRYVWEAWRGPYVILTRPIEGKDGHQEVWTLSVKTGDLKKTELKLPAHQSIRGINQAGDGKTLLLLNTVPRAAELWVMENLFPPVAAAK